MKFNIGISLYIKIFILIILIWITVAIVQGIRGDRLGDSYYAYMTDAYYFIGSSKLDDFYLYGVLDYENDQRYIIALKLKGSGYTCQHFNHFAFSKILEYIIIDKKVNKISSTESKKKFEDMKRKLGIKMNFSITKNKINTILEKKIFFSKIVDGCIDVNQYPVEEY